MFFNKTRIRLVSALTVVLFVATTFLSSAEVMAQTAPVQNLDLSQITNALGAHPEVQMLQGNLSTMENTLRQIEQTSIPLYNKIAPSNMEAMSIGERIKAIIGNTKTLVKQGTSAYRGQVNDWNQAHGITPNTSFEEELSVGLNQLGMETSKMPMNGTGNTLVEKLKTIVGTLKEKITQIISMIRAKIVALAQKVGLVKKNAQKSEKEATQSEDDDGVAMAQEPQAQYADTSFTGKLGKGLSDGLKNAKTSLKQSFSVSNLALTAGVAVGTNLAIQLVRGEKPSLGKAVKLVASAEFAGSVVGSALGAAGGQVASTLIKTFVPGPIGALAGSLVNVMSASLGGQMGSNTASNLKNGKLNIVGAFKAIDKWDLVGSSIGSTVGMTLGAFIPIPVVGPMIGGIVGGFLGSKVAGWVKGWFKGNKSISATVNSNPSMVAPSIPNSGVTIGGDSGVGGGAFQGAGISLNQAPAANLQQAEQQYYTTYLQYNRLIEKGDYENAKKVYEQLKVYSDQYQAMKGSAK